MDNDDPMSVVVVMERSPSTLSGDPKPVTTIVVGRRSFMKLLVLQPRLESGTSQLQTELSKHPQVDAIVFPEGHLNENVPKARALAKQYSTILIGGYRRFNETPKDRAILITRDGEVILDRPKYTSTVHVTIEGLIIGHILCDEVIVQRVKSGTLPPCHLPQP